MWCVVCVLPALALLAGGCGGGDKPDKPQVPAVKPGAGDKGGGTKGPSTSTGGLTAVEATGVATLKGKVTYDGTPPTRPQLNIPDDNKDKAFCLMGDTKDPTWIVDAASKGVKNVVVWLREPEGHYFKIPADQQGRKATVKIDQPHCAFEPHVVALFPYFYDPDTKKLKKTGEVLKVDNSAPVNHNTAWSFTKRINTGNNVILKSKEEITIEAKPGREDEAGGEELISINCDIHKWMTGKAVVFDHPYFAVTKEDGTYEIKNAPAGAELVLAFWHESFGSNSLKKDAKTDKITLKAGDNTKDLTIK